MLRIAVALGAIRHGWSVFGTPDGSPISDWAIASLAILVGLGLLIGILTPLAGGAAACGYLAMAASDFLSNGMNDDWKTYALMNLSIMSIALVLLGPGAVSLDAHLFGRREIIIPEGRRSPRQ